MATGIKDKVAIIGMGCTKFGGHYVLVKEVQRSIERLETVQQVILPVNRLTGWKRSVPATWRNHGQERRKCSGIRTANRYLLITLTLALGSIVALVWLVGGPVSREAQAMPGDPSYVGQDEIDEGFICVAISGEDTDGCGAENNPCRTVQHAADEALPGGEIRVAAGTYTGTNSYGGLSQLVYLTKTLTIRGGYTTSNWTMPDPEANPTTLDAEGNGRVLVIWGTITAHVEGLGFQGGDATELGGRPAVEPDGSAADRDAGGGLYILTGTVTISNCTIFSNTGSTTGPAYGGGLYVRGGTVALRHNEIVSNTAGTSVYGFGGGVYLDLANAALLNNTVMSNTASYWDDGQGGGLYLYGGSGPGFPSASLIENTLQGNYASRRADGQGGGMYTNHYQVELLDNLVQYNTGGAADEGKGGGLYTFFSDALLERNLVRYNIASRGDEGISGGVHFCTCGDVTLENNTIFSNTASIKGNGYGGGMSFCKTKATLDSNRIISNTATLSTGLEVKGWGGGVWTGDRASLSMSNDLVAGNHAKTQGSGLWFGVENEGYNPLGSRLQHVTIADNSGGSGHGVYVTNTVAFLTNTIIAGHLAFGVFVPSGGAATLEATLWYENGQNTTFGSNVETGDRNYEGDPAFVDPDAWDYHIEPGSAALDLGVATGVRSDMDGERRPWLAPDLGADEYWPPGVFIRAYLPLVLRHSTQE